MMLKEGLHSSIPAMNIAINASEKIKEIVRQVFINSVLSSSSGRNLTSEMSKPSMESIPSKPIAAIIADARPTSAVE
ncbi:MAG: hypothetical protein WBD09_02045 [Halobacteriota archaeon]